MQDLSWRLQIRLRQSCSLSPSRAFCKPLVMPACSASDTLSHKTSHVEGRAATTPRKMCITCRSCEKMCSMGTPNGCKDTEWRLKSLAMECSSLCTAPSLVALSNPLIGFSRPLTSFSILISTDGKSSCPAKRPFWGLRTNIHAEPSDTAATANFLSRRFFWATFRGNCITLGTKPAWSNSFALQTDRSGQPLHKGLVGVQTVAPSSMRPWLNAPGSPGSTNSCANLQLSLNKAGDFIGRSIAQSLLKTRATFPSTSAAGCPKAMEAMAPAVYGPTPGICCNSSTEDGKDPPNLATTCWAPSCKHLARR